MFGACPVCSDNFLHNTVGTEGQKVIKVYCPLDTNHFDLTIRDPMAVRDLSRLKPVGSIK